MATYICPECGEGEESVADARDHLALKHGIGQANPVGDVTLREGLAALNKKAESLDAQIQRLDEVIGQALVGHARLSKRLEAIEDALRNQPSANQMRVPVREAISEKERRQLDALMRQKPTLTDKGEGVDG